MRHRAQKRAPQLLGFDLYARPFGFFGEACALERVAI